ncbi:MAG TPA: hypothetical protein VEL03_20835 [Streptosporangiaceae bacterium]|nr:hypothetical protein [Streptosporangiaceae bacterium]
MPGQRRTVGPRTRGSWLPVFAGLAAIVILAGVASVVYVAEFHPGRSAASSASSSRVASFQTVGLVAEQPLPDGSMVQLLGSGRGVTFSPVGASQQQEGDPEWTADLMVGGTYIFIYLPTSQCLASAGPGARPVLAVMHCDLGAQQRWRRLGSGVATGGHYFYEFANDATGKCITEAGAGQPAAGLAACDQSQPASELLSFWWSSS